MNFQTYTINSIYEKNYYSEKKNYLQQEREFAVVKNFSETKFGTEASFAGDHNIVKASSIKEATKRPSKLFTKGKTSITNALPISQKTMTRLRSQRSTKTPAKGPKKKPGAILAPKTRLNAAPSFPEPTLMAKMLQNKPESSEKLLKKCWENVEKFEKMLKKCWKNVEKV